MHTNRHTYTPTTLLHTLAYTHIASLLAIDFQHQFVASTLKVNAKLSGLQHGIGGVAECEWE